MIRFFRKTKMSNRLTTVAVSILSFIAVFSCVKNDRTLGQQFISEDYVLSVDSTSFDIPFRQRVHDTIQSVSYSKVMFGYITDDLYGTTVVDGASVVVPVSDSSYLGVNPKYVDAYLTLTVDSTVVYTRGNNAIPQNIYLYELIKDVAGDSTMYYNNSITPDCLSSDPISIGSPMLFGTGNVKIGLTRDFGEKLLATSPAEFKDITLFLDRVFGIYVKTDKPDKHVVGGRLNYMSLSTSVITVEYLMNDPEKGIKDKDTTVNFVFGYSFALNQFSAGSRHLETEHPSDVLYLDGLSGVKPVIPGLELKDLVDKWADGVCLKEECDKGSILISQAKLILPYDIPDDFEMFEKEHPAKIFPFTTNVGAADTTVRMEPLSGILAAAGGYMDRSHEYYYCDISSHIQELIHKDRGDINQTDDLWICPVNTLLNSSTYVTSYILDVDDYHRVALKGPASDRKPRLEIVYGLLKKW